LRRGIGNWDEGLNWTVKKLINWNKRERNNNKKKQIKIMERKNNN
jgi:hypothetical protein